MASKQSSRKRKATPTPSPKPVKPIMSYREFAEHRGVNYASVRRWLDQGYVKQISNGRIDVAASDAILDARAPAGPGSKSVLAGNDSAQANDSAIKFDANAPFTASEAARRKANLALKEAELEFALKAGALVRIEDATAAFTEQASIVRDRLLAIPSSMAPRLLHQTNVADVEHLLSVAINFALEELCADAHAATRKLEAEIAAERRSR
ncbi:MAG TPA: hypothetical protein VLR92_08800 [Blastocatellia bacterium]|nr:hypothetical protein [Blastocatellia bacterium]